VDLVIQDMNFAADTTGGEEGRALFREIRERHPRLPVILLTRGRTSTWRWSSSRRAPRTTSRSRGATSAGDGGRATSWSWARPTGRCASASSATRAAGAAAEQYDTRGMVWRDAATQRVLRARLPGGARRRARAHHRPNGSGKERVAEIIQANFRRAQTAPSSHSTAGRFPPTWSKPSSSAPRAGAYTGAGKSRPGKFEGGRWRHALLDEIGNLPAAGQVKLLRVSRRPLPAPLGSNEEKQVRVRIVSATNADLSAMIRAGTFRQDLYYRPERDRARPSAARAGVRRHHPLAEHFVARQGTSTPRGSRAAAACVAGATCAS
jgi:DNA-binding NtrC family response regulator